MSTGKNSPTKVQPTLLKYATRSLRLRYSRIFDDIVYWEKLHTSQFVGEHAKQFNSVKYDLGIIAAEEIERTKLDESLDKAHKDLIAFEDTINRGVSPEALPTTLSEFKKREDFLSPDETGDEINPQVAWWVYFRTALEQRMVPQYRSFLEKVDVIARDCYYPLLKSVENLTGYNLQKQKGWLSPISILEFGQVYRTLTSQTAPVPFIFVPIDRIDNVWNLCAVHHEVAHDFYYKLNAFDPNKHSDDSSTVDSRFRKNVEKEMGQNNFTEEELFVYQFFEADTYLDWLEETFADMVGIMLAGPIYIRSLQEILVDEDVISLSSKNYPSKFIRVLINIIFATGKLNALSNKEVLELTDRWVDIFSRNTSTKKAVPPKTQIILLKNWFGQTSPFNETIFNMVYNASEELVQQMNKQRAKILKAKEKQFGFWSSEKGETTNAEELTTVGLMGWLIKFVNAIWQAELLPGVNLCRINEQMECLEYKYLFRDEIAEGREKLHHTQQKRLREEIELIMKSSVDNLREEKFASCRPRFLVSAARLAFEESISKEKKNSTNKSASDTKDTKKQPIQIKIRQFFIDSLQEQAEVANHFRFLEKTAGEHLTPWNIDLLQEIKINRKARLLRKNR